MTYQRIKSVVTGRKLLRKLRSQYGKDTFFFFLRGHSGDVYIQMMLIDAYVRQYHITKYQLLGDGEGLSALSTLFLYPNSATLPSVDTRQIQDYYFFTGKQDKSILFPFFWNPRISFNSSRLRLTEGLTFMDTYTEMAFRLKKPFQVRSPVFPALDDALRKRLDMRGFLPGNTILISYDAYSVESEFSDSFWSYIIGELKKKGYKVFINQEESHESSYGADNLFLPYSAIVPALEWGGYFLGVRSGLCDIISTAKCKKVILYPQKRERINYDGHRSETEFSGLAVMGLCQDDQNLTELSTRLIRNRVDLPLLLTERERADESDILTEKILGCFI